MAKEILTIEVKTSGEVNIKKLQKDVQKLSTSIDQVNVKKLNDGLKDTSSSAGLAGATLTETGRLISDLPFGIGAVTNNLSQLSTMFGTLVISSGGFGKAMKSLGQQLRSGLGVILAFQVLISLLEAFKEPISNYISDTFGASKATRAYANALKEASEAVSGEVSSLQTLLAVAKDEKISKEDRQKAVEQINKDYPEYLENVSLEEIANKDLNTQIEKQIELELKRAKARAIADEMAKVQQEIIQAETQSLKENLGVTDFLRVTIKNSFAGLNADIGGLTEQAVKNREETVRKGNDTLSQLQGKLLELLKDDGVVDALIDKETKTGEKRREKQKEAYLNSVRFLELELISFDKMKEARTDDLNHFMSTEEKRLEIEEKSAKARAGYDQLVQEQRESTFDSFAHIASNVGKILGEQTEEGKAFAVAAATIDTYVAANRILKDPFYTGNPFAKFAAVAATISTGLMNVRAIIKTDTSGKTTTSPSSTPIQPPSFNVVGASQQSQLAQTIAQAGQQPIKAFVVAEDVTTAQQLDRNIIQGASLG
jgi:hypothetical protein